MSSKQVSEPVSKPVSKPISEPVSDEMNLVCGLYKYDMERQFRYCQSYENNHLDTLFPDFKTELCCNGYINRCKIKHRDIKLQTSIVNTNSTNQPYITNQQYCTY